VHAFLDEVFDGRDMLLRSALNILHERELKTGTKTVAGKIECALMTSNRYLAEILESDRLVAFVDRIAFLSFVPKSFAAPDTLDRVLREQIARTGAPGAPPRLTVQDLDVLQAAVDQIDVGDGMCSAVAELARRFDAEIGAARRADPGFIPSRYLSTRTVVRMAGLLRAVAFYDWMFDRPDRPWRAEPADLARLRLGFTLCGPGAAETEKLIEVENDPRERRQLGIIRTEQEIFARCLDGLPAKSPSPAAPAGVSKELLAQAEPAAMEGLDTTGLLELCRKLAREAGTRRRGADEARACLERTTRELGERALRLGLAWDAPDPLSLATTLGELATELEREGRSHLRVARWLRGRALEDLTRTLPLAAVFMDRLLSAAVATTGALGPLEELADAAFGRLERLHALREELRRAGADEEDPTAGDRALAAATSRLAEALAPVMASGFRTARTALLAAGLKGPALADELRALAPMAQLARNSADRLARLRSGDDKGDRDVGDRGDRDGAGEGQTFFSAVLEPVVAPAVRRAFESILGSRQEVVTEVRARINVLAGSGLAAALPLDEVLSWVAAALLRAPAETDAAEASTAGGPTAGPTGAPDLQGYRRLRQNMPEGTAAGLLVDAYLKLGIRRAGGAELDDPDRVVRRLADAVRSFPVEVRGALAARDVDHVARPVAYLERWWKALADDLPANQRSALERLERSRFFRLTHDEGALARFALEARLVALVLDEAPVAPLLERLRLLERDSTGQAQALMGAVAGRPPATPASRS
jgi:hypothetical protein